MRKELLCFGFAVAVVAACGGTVAQEVTTVPGAKPVGSLTEEEKKQLCEDSRAYLERALASVETSFRCQGQAFGRAQGSACQQAYASCMQNPPPPNGSAPSGLGFNCSNTNVDPRCASVTVEEFSTCLRDVANLFKSVASKLPACSEAEVLPLMTQLQQPPSSCQALQQKGCPIFGSTMSSGPTPVPPTDPPVYDAGAGG
jgi:hypothetical protein